MLFKRFLEGMRDHFGDAERRISVHKVLLNALVATLLSSRRCNYITGAIQCEFSDFCCYF